MTCPTVCQPDCDATCHEAHFAAPDRRHEPSSCRPAADRLTHDPTPPRVPPAGDSTYDGLTGRELFDVKRQELDLRHALTPSIERDQEATDG